MGKLYEFDSKTVSSNSNSFRITNIDDIKNFTLGFGNGESLFISSKHIKGYSLDIDGFVSIANDPIFKNALIFSRGVVKIDLPHLYQIFGYDVRDKFLLKSGINHIIIEYDNNYKMKSDIPLMLLLPNSECNLIEIEDDNILKVMWFHPKL